MNLPYYLQFLHWRITALGGKSDAILQTKLYIMLKSSEVVALLRVLSILHIAICMPTRWLAGKTHELSEYSFGYYDMGEALDAMEKAFESILDNCELILDEDFMMNQIFADITERVDPFREYIEYMWMERSGHAVSKKSEDKVLPFDLLRAALFYPTRADIVETDELCSQLAVVAAMAFLTEFRDTSKATHNYLSSIDGKLSLKVISEEQRLEGMRKEASNSISESNFASATQSLKTCGTIRLDSAAAEGQTRTNNDFGRCHERFVNASKKDEFFMQRGLLFQLPPELVKSLFHTAKKSALRLKKRHDSALELARQHKLDKIKSRHEVETAKSTEKNIIAMNFYEIGTSDRRWKSIQQAKEIYNQLNSESSKLLAVKEQIQIRRIGFGWEECGHPWSRNGEYFTSRELLSFLIDVVIPFELKRGIPSEPAVDFTTKVLTTLKLGTESSLEFIDETINPRNTTELLEDAIEERERRENEFLTDRDSMLQPNVMPNVDKSLVGFPIEVCFEYDGEDGAPFTAWCDGTVMSVINEKTRMVLIKWNEKKVAEGDAQTSKHKLGIRGWNPKHPKSGAWRKFVGDPNA